MRMSRRQLLGGGLAGASLALGAAGELVFSDDLRAAPRRVRAAGSMPRPTLAAGTDLVPQIEHFVVVMMENHSFDNILGLIGRGDGFTLGPDGQPTAKNPDGNGNYVHAFHMPTECQTNGVGNDWKVTHEAYDGGTCQGFVTSTTAEAMGYFTKDDLPFTCGMARDVSDRRSVLLLGHGPDGSESAVPHRRDLLGLIDDTFPPALPPNGVIFEQFNKHGITWKDYYTSLPTLGVFLPLLRGQRASRRAWPRSTSSIVDAAAGTLPSFSLVEAGLRHISPRRIPRTSSSAISSWARSSMP